MIDDSFANVNAFRAAGGEAILFPEPWNANYAIRDRLGYVKAQLGLLAESVEAIDFDKGPWSSRSLSLISQAMIGEPFQLAEFIKLRTECVVLRLVDGHVLKITMNQASLPEPNKLSLPVIDQGYVDVSDREGQASLFWFIQPHAETPIQESDFQPFLEALPVMSLRMTDPSLEDLGYYLGQIRILDPWSVTAATE